ncbi:glutamine--tRNA ligase/YqeY domain fusion protein [soil metagenome]
MRGKHGGRDEGEEGRGVALDFIRAMVAEDVRRGRHGGRVVTRFPPEPNGFLHIGHAKSICLNFGIAEEVSGARCHLRFDDTNPETEDVKYVESIRDDVRWLGFDWGEHLYFASDYFEQMYAVGEHLIREGKAYVDSSTEEEIREARGTVMEPGRPTAWRDRSIDESLELFRRMRAGEFPNGAQVLRAKIDLAATNMLMRDPILYRIRHAHHYRTGDAWCIYPLYDYAHPIEDAIESVTHSLCTLEFENNREFYDWLVDSLPRTGESAIPPDSRPEQTEFARLALDYTVMSKRKLLQLVNDGHVGGWDDPRMPTIAGLRRRGVTPESIRAFCDLIGVSKANTRVDIAKLEYAIRDDLNQRAPRVMCVLRPLRVTITNWPADHVEILDASYWPHDVPKQGTRPVPFSGELYIERDDFAEDPPKGFFRLAPGREVRLRYGYIIRCDDVVKNDAGDVVELRCTYDPETRGGAAAPDRKVRGTLHWVSAPHALPCEVRLYDRLFSVADPEADPDVDFRERLNPDSLTVAGNAMIEPSVRDATPGTHYQFERLGYFTSDLIDSRSDRLVFNRTVTLRDTWSKIAPGAEKQASPGRPDRQPARPAGRQRQAGLAAATSTTAAASSAIGASTGAPAAAARETELLRTPELEARLEQYLALGVSAEQADLLTRDVAVSALFGEALQTTSHARPLANWVVNEIPREAREQAASLQLTGRSLGQLVEMVEANELSSSAGREVLAELIERGGDPREIVERRGLRQVSDEATLGAQIDEVLAANPAKVEEYRGGRTGLMGFFVGQAMGRSGGRANPALLKRLLEERLDGH